MISPHCWNRKIGVLTKRKSKAIKPYSKKYGNSEYPKINILYRLPYCLKRGGNGFFSAGQCFSPSLIGQGFWQLHIIKCNDLTWLDVSLEMNLRSEEHTSELQSRENL